MFLSKNIIHTNINDDDDTKIICKNGLSNKMASFDPEKAEMNAREIKALINGFLLNARKLCRLTMTITDEVLAEHPEIIEEDERRCVARETEERIAYINSKIGGMDVPRDLIDEYTEEASRKINKLRILRARVLLEQGWRLSHILDERGYIWTDFFSDESHIPTEETIAVQAADSESKRNEYRHVIITKFIKHTYEFWDQIKRKDIDFLVNHLGTLFPDSEYTDKLEILYGNNEDKKNYVSDKYLEIIWKFIHGLVKTSIKYMHYIGKNTFRFKKTDPDGNVRIVRTLVIDCDEEIEKWGVNLEVRLN